MMSRLRLCVCMFVCSLFSSSLLAFFHSKPEPQDLYVSLLTVGVGTGLESRFGHTILRLKNTKTGEEHLLNWGTFDFSQPYYVPKFVKGLLRYWVAESSYEGTLNYYANLENRSVEEDLLAFTDTQKSRLMDRLMEELKPEKIYFWYDFFYNNCSTIPRDILNDILFGKIKSTYESVPASMNLRNYVRRDLHEWAIVDFFLDMMLNSDVDGKISAWVEMFHPIMLRQYLSAMPQMDDQGQEIAGSKLLTHHKTLVGGGQYPGSPFNLFHVSFVLGMLCLLSVLVLKRRKPLLARRLLGAGLGTWGFFAGLMGLVFLAGWLFSNHHMLHHNVNLLVFWPTDFALIVVGLRLLRGGTWQWGRVGMIYMGLHALGWFVHTLGFILGIFQQDISNIVYFLNPLMGLLLFLSLFLRN